MAKKQKPVDLQAMRHSAEHVLTMAMLALYPRLLPAMGPATEEGFYFDFVFASEDKVKIQEKDFPKIEKKMREIILNDYPITHQELNVRQARKIFKNNPYKLEWVDEIEKRGEMVSVYTIGDPKTENSFVDLCSGPHIESTGKIGPFKLLSIAGAYWHGDEKNKMLTRIYGTAFNTQEELDRYLWQKEEAEKRNHRKLGAELELFAIYPEIGQGLPVWLPNGFVVRRELEDYMLREERKLDYKHAITPVLSNEALFQTSGHLGFYKDSMYPPIMVDEEKLYLKPMSCPAAMIIYKSKPRSYRDLPYKLGEFGLVYRYEKSGELQGLQRVRGFTQNDAHIFFREDQTEEQLTEVINFLKKFYKDLGFTKYWMRLSLSGPNDKKYDIAPREEWLKAENNLRKVLKENGLEFEEAVGEAAFYGPKIDIQAVNVFGKEDTISTIQYDFNFPKRFELEYIDADGQPKQPYVLHRALIGSFERFFSFLIEHYGGAFPVWLAPVQVAILPIAERHSRYGSSIKVLLQNEEIRVELDNRQETLQAKIRDAQLKKVPYMLIVGDKEQEAGTVAVRLRNGTNLGAIKLAEFTAQAKKAMADKINI
ncbi:MAG: threonine--tRNA ligase [Candidatus Blackburnbacteria bacterium]|nr:threonine--tRNA ligase [Candidatus Blackburnbacteria bacterium]